ncbi:type I restriction endonuclease subunit R [Nostoc sp. FACHB-190]|uniref:type I restriction endonuclease subunit R n=1 Tax=Nostoc sp. FACHB-190 TaxID=2692838 RepID=UPI0016885E75|nr:HsdR family type I site-specific deoxyribonuclease [Nostoc sp. FACHB-190]MBD2302217.1 type I restriction endonuclease subunit R [Nostoc sp. FACHB-190]
MPKFQFDEKCLSQIPVLQLLINLGYNYLTPEEIKSQRRGKLSNVLLEDILSKQLQEINRITFKRQEYQFSEANIQEAILRLKNVRYDGLLKTNEEIYDYLTLGTSLEQTIDGSSKSYSLRYIDWRNWQNNVFNVTAEFSVERTHSTETARLDIVLFVNGIPFAVIECKSPKIEVEQAVSQCIRNQRDEYIPQLFIYTQLLLATNKNEVKYATTGTSAKFWAVWREEFDTEEDIAISVNTPLQDEQENRLFSSDFAPTRSFFDNLAAEGSRQITVQDRTLYSLCRPERLLDIAYQFTVFDAGVRKVARYQQFFAVKNILQRVKQFDDRGGRKGGVIWHTQGSGKSLTMVMMARALALDPDILNPRIVLVTDRVDLDDQIKKTFASCGMQPVKAISGRHLAKLIEEKKANIITTLINKFTAALGVRKFSDPDPNIFILVDESHRSQYGSFHPKMRQVLPNGCYLGFTGTPLMKKQKNTFARFGGIIEPSYTIRRAVEDGAVVPLLYEGRHSEQQVNQKAIDTWFERLCQGLTDQQKTDLKRKYSQAAMLNKTEQTIYCRAFDISEHYRQNWQRTGFKAQLVAPGKESALKYKQFLDEIGYVTSEVIISPPDNREGYEDVEDEPSDEVQKFWQQMMKRYGSEREYNQQLINSFKNGDTPEILIVVDKLLTGFDAPRNTVLYLTRSLKEHTLLQAIARVNRLYSNEATCAEKEFGYIIDYAGILGDMDKALTAYSALEGFEEEDLADTLTNIRKEISKLPQHYAELLDIFKEIQNTHDEEAYEQLLGNEKLRDEFYERLAQYAKTLAMSLSSDKFLLETPEQKIDRYKKDLKRFQNLKAAVKLRYQETVDYRDLEPKIQKLLDTHISATEVVQIAAPFNIFDEAQFQTIKEQQKDKPASRADIITSATKRTITERMQEDPAFYRQFSELIQQTINDFRAKRISEAEYLRKAEEIRDAIVNRKTDNQPNELRHNPVALAFYGLIKPVLEKHIQNQTEIDTISASAAIAIYNIIDKRTIVDWINNENVQKNMMNDIDDYLYDVIRDEHDIDIDHEQMDTIIQESLQIARRRMAK